MPRAKSHRRALAARRRMAERQPWSPAPPVPEFVARKYFFACFSNKVAVDCFDLSNMVSHSLL